MASGAAQMLGFKLRANFVAPYLTKSFFQFWNHWHITLGHWLKDYVYIPLGGNRKGVKRKCINLSLGLCDQWYLARFDVVICFVGHDARLF